jgi:uncharacterized Zn finger protein (UPF0148 family)
MICYDCGKEFKVSDNEIYCPYCQDEIDNEDSEDYRERELEQRENELAERAATCKCGAWQFAKDGSVIHVADCCCGAE